MKNKKQQHIDLIKQCFKQKISQKDNVEQAQASNRQCLSPQDIERMKYPNISPQTYQLPKIVTIPKKNVSAFKAERKTIIQEQINLSNPYQSPAYYSPQFKKSTLSSNQYFTDRKSPQYDRQFGFKPNFDLPYYVSQNNCSPSQVKLYTTNRFKPFNKQRENLFLAPNIYNIK